MSNGKGVFDKLRMISIFHWIVLIELLIPGVFSSVQLPSNDSFYTPPSGYESKSPGEILRLRQVTINTLYNVASAYQILYRTENNNGSAEAAVTTLLIPEPASSDRLLSYQLSEDAVYIGCAPSYQLQVESILNFTSIYGYNPQYGLNRGWYVSIPDYEGPNSSFMANHQAGKATLDAIRAVLRSGNVTNIASNASVSMWGYSSGAYATAWAAELQSLYAPELNISGAAVGEFVANITAISLHDNDNAYSMWKVLALLGMATQYPELKQLLDQQLDFKNSSVFDKAKDQCKIADSTDYNDQNIYSYFKDGNQLLYNSYVQSLIKNNTLGSFAPEIPMYIYQGQDSKLVPADSVDKVVDEYCKDGATIEYIKALGEGHESEDLAGAPGAFSWIMSRMEGSSISSGCTTITSSSTSRVIASTTTAATTATLTTSSGSSTSTQSSAAMGIHAQHKLPVHRVAFTFLLMLLVF